MCQLVRRSWGIERKKPAAGYDTLPYPGGLVWRYQLYAQAASPQELLDEEMDQEEQESVCRAWRFAQRYKSQYAPEFLSGWDIGRAAMLTRWGCYLGWITQGEQQAFFGSFLIWRQSGCTAGGNLRSLTCLAGLCGKCFAADSSAESYLGYLADAATDLLSAKEEAYWRQCPWPEQKRIGFVG